MASCAIARITPSEATGQTSDSIRVMKATSSPGRQRAAADADGAEQQDDDHREVGDHLQEGPERAESRTLSMLVSSSRRAASSY